MSTVPPATPATPELPVLDPLERRLLGVLVEKAKTTPDIYPLSLNALVTGCNQKSNREPVMNVTEEEAQEALARLQKRVLVFKVTGGRVVRWRHNLYDGLGVTKVELAVLTELLLRGPQTEGELRGRASRMEPIDDLETLRTVLRGLAHRKLAVFLSPEGRRGTTVTHGFHPPEEVQRLKASAAAGPASAELAESPSVGISREASTELAELKAEVADLRRLLTELQARVEALASEIVKSRPGPEETPPAGTSV